MTSDRITLAHGGGSAEMQRLIQEMFLPTFDNSQLATMEDQARLNWQLQPGERLAFSTDTFVVSPLTFPGGDIATLAVNGTVNDVAMSGAVPKVLSCAMVIEEGLLQSQLQTLCQSMARAASAAGVQIVTGDTKVVPKGQADQLYINTSGLGVIASGVDLGTHRIAEGDHVLVSGPIGEHGATIISCREDLSLDADIASDCQPLHQLVCAMLAAIPGVKSLRDATRGGVAAVLHEFATASRLSILLSEQDIPVSAPVNAMCELLGFNPLHLACEGRLIAVVSAQHSEDCLAAMRNHPAGDQAAMIGRVITSAPSPVIIESSLGVKRALAPADGELLPRIC
ncbi:hydrogenase expression/formation protein HypE [Corallincola platygyrae]|uniref:Hydrogenase expression/formation protein HypE n=1 Tax=Corallincola platygyrae TaxID=1193278 RepID=A0ABW4XKI2_9GAMM